MLGPVERFGNRTDVGFFDRIAFSPPRPASYRARGARSKDVGKDRARLSSHMICVMRVVEIWPKWASSDWLMMALDFVGLRSNGSN